MTTENEKFPKGSPTFKIVENSRGSRRERRHNNMQVIKNMQKPPVKFSEIDPRASKAPKWITRLFINNRFIVMVDDNAKTTKGLAIKAMIRQNNAEPIKNHWSQIQKIKNEIFGADAIAVEYYPAEEDLTDVANIYWIWLFPAGVLPEPI